MASPNTVLLEPYCILCRSTVPCDIWDRPNIGINPPKPEPWEEQFYCFYEMSARGKESKRRGYLTRLSGRASVDMQIKFHDEVEKRLRNAGKTLCYMPYRGDYNLEHTVNLVHAHCLELAKTKLPRISIHRLCQIAWLLRPVAPWLTINSISASKQSVLAALPRSVHATTELGALIKMTVESLPRELEALVCDMVPHSLFTSMANCLATLEWIGQNGFMHRTNYPLPLTTSLPLSQYSAEYRTLGADIISIRGEGCLTKIGTDPSVTYSHTISLPDQPLDGLQYVLGTYGVTGLRLHYQDGSYSPWLGRHVPTTWHKFVEGSDLERLEVQSDGSKIISIFFKQAEGKASTKPHTTQLLWDRDMTMLPNAKRLMANMSQGLEVPIRGDPTTRYAEYLPFRFDDGKSHSITAYCSPRGVRCIEIDGDTQRRLGTPSESCCPITHYLRPYETVQSVHAVGSGMRDMYSEVGFFLMMRTSGGRSLYFGPYTVPIEETAVGSIHNFADDTAHSPSGIFAVTGFPEALCPPTCLGVSLQPRRTPLSTEEQLLQPALLSLPAFSEYQWNVGDEAFPEVSMIRIAALAGARRLRAQRLGDRCVGVLAEMGDDTTCTFGQWNPARTNTISTLYDQDEDGPLCSLTFAFSKGPTSRRHVVDIRVNSSAEIATPHLIWDDLSKELAWFFTHEHDFLKSWDGQYAEFSATDVSEEIIRVN